MKTMKRASVLALCALAAACGSDDPTPPSGTVYLLTDANRLITVKSTAPTLLGSSLQIRGLNANETLVGVDFRPADGQLYGVTDANDLIKISIASGEIVDRQNLNVGVQGSDFGVDFNPVVDRLRVVSDSGQNLRVDPSNAVVAQDDDIAPPSSRLTAAAYTNSFTNACDTSLYVIDAQSGQLLLQTPPNAGELVKVGALGISVNAASGFDIDGENNRALAVLTKRSGVPFLAQVNLTTGALTDLGALDLPAGEFVRGLAVVPGRGEPPVVLGDMLALADVADPTRPDRLISFNRNQPGKLCSAANITGLQPGDTVQAIDVRPLDGRVYALATGTADTLYQLDPRTGEASNRRVLLADPSAPGFVSLPLERFGMDFDATPVSVANPPNTFTDSLLVTSNGGQVFRINADGGTVRTETGTVEAPSAAATNSLASATGVTLFVLNENANSGTGSLQTRSSGGILTTVGSLNGVPSAPGVIAGVSGFDIDGFATAPNSNGVFTNAARAVFNTGVAATTAAAARVDSDLYAVNLAPGGGNALTLLGTIAKGRNHGLDQIKGLTFTRTPQVSVFASTGLNQLLSFSPLTPNSVLRLNIDGLTGNENIIGIDFRTQDALLYAVTNQGRIYTLIPSATAVTAVLTDVVLAADPADTSDIFTPPLPDGLYGMDFNPAKDKFTTDDCGSTSDASPCVTRLRLANSNRKSFRSRLVTGETVTDTDLNGGGIAGAVGAAYDNGVSSSGKPRLFLIDNATDALYSLSSATPNTGAAALVGGLTVDIANDADAGFDIAGGHNGLALAALKAISSGKYELYRVDLTSGVATPVRGNSGFSNIGTGNDQIRGLAIQVK